MSRLYDSAFFERTREQAGLLRRLRSERADTPLDPEDVAEEIAGSGRSDLECPPAADPRPAASRHGLD